MRDDAQIGHIENWLRQNDADGTMPDADVALAINADHRLNGPVDLARLAGEVLYPAGLVVRQADGTLAGPLVAAISNEAYPAELRGGLERFLAGLSDPRIQSLDSKRADIAAQLAAVLGGLVATGLLDDAQVDAIVALGDGPRWPRDVTEADVTEARARMARREEADAINAAAQTYADRVRAVAQAYIDDPDVELPIVPEAVSGGGGG